MANLTSFFKLLRLNFRSLSVKKDIVLSSAELSTGVSTNLVKTGNGILKIEVVSPTLIDGNDQDTNTDNPCFHPFLYETPIKPSRFNGKYVIYTILTVYIFYVLCVARYLYDTYYMCILFFMCSTIHFLTF